jgi:hypothetical protein
MDNIFIKFLASTEAFLFWIASLGAITTFTLVGTDAPIWMALFLLVFPFSMLMVIEMDLEQKQRMKDMEDLREEQKKEWDSFMKEVNSHV